MIWLIAYLVIGGALGLFFIAAGLQLMTEEDRSKFQAKPVRTAIRGVLLFAGFTLGWPLLIIYEWGNTYGKALKERGLKERKQQSKPKYHFTEQERRAFFKPYDSSEGAE